MVGSKAHKSFALPAVALLCLYVVACGGASKGTSSASSNSSLAAATDGAVSGTVSSTTPARSNLYGDYDGDDHGEAQYGGDADNDDITKRRDKDNDTDNNNSNNYYDMDDNSVRDFGCAAGVVDKRTITAVVKRYFFAAAAEDGATACSMIVSTLANAVPEDVGRPPGPPYARGGTCAVVMSKVFKANHMQLAAYVAKLEVSGVRVNHDSGLAVLGFRTLPGRMIRVAHERGSWKIDAVLDSELP